MGCFMESVAVFNVHLDDELRFCGTLKESYLHDRRQSMLDHIDVAWATNPTKGPAMCTKLRIARTAWVWTLAGILFFSWDGNARASGLTITPAGAAQGLSLTTFASNFPTPGSV